MSGELATDPESEEHDQRESQSDKAGGERYVTVAVRHVHGVMSRLVVEEEAEDGEEAGGEEDQEAEGEGHQEARKQTQIAQRNSEDPAGAGVGRQAGRGSQFACGHKP